MSRMPSTRSAPTAGGHARGDRLNFERTGLPTAQDQRRRASTANETGPGSNLTDLGTRPTSASSRRCSTRSRSSTTGSVTTAMAAPDRPPRHEALRRGLVDARWMPGARVRKSSTRAGTSQRLAVPTTPRLALPASRPGAREVGPQRVELGPHAAGPLDHHLAELGRLRAPAAADEQRNFELPLELTHMTGTRSTGRCAADRRHRRTSRLRKWRGARRADGPPYHSILSDLEMESIVKTCWTDWLPGSSLVPGRIRGTGTPPLVPRIAPFDDGREVTRGPQWCRQCTRRPPGDLNWMAEGACKGETRLYFATPGERPEARERRRPRRGRSACNVP